MLVVGTANPTNSVNLKILILAITVGKPSTNTPALPEKKKSLHREKLFISDTARNDAKWLNNKTPEENIHVVDMLRYIPIHEGLVRVKG